MDLKNFQFQSRKFDVCVCVHYPCSDTISSIEFLFMVVHFFSHSRIVQLTQRSHQNPLTKALSHTNEFTQMCSNENKYAFWLRTSKHEQRIVETDRQTDRCCNLICVCMYEKKIEYGKRRSWWRRRRRKWRKMQNIHCIYRKKNILKEF